MAGEAPGLMSPTTTPTTQASPYGQREGAAATLQSQIHRGRQ